MSHDDRRISKSQPAALIGSWHDQNAEWLLKILQNRLRVDRSQADDLLQDTWVKVLRAPQVRVDHPRAFLLKIATNLFRDARRRDNLHAYKRELWSSSEGSAFQPQSLEEQEADRLLEQIISSLPEPLRDVFVLSRFQRMTNRDIASHLGISVKTVEARISKALELCLTKLRD